MAVERILSLREPRVTVYLGLSLALAALAGAGLDLAVRQMLRDLTDLAAESPDAAILRAAAWMTGLTVFLCAFTLLMSGALFHAFGRAIAERCMPPSGAWSVGAVRRVTGDAAVRMARIGQGLSFALALCGVAFGVTACWFVSRVVACAARHL